MADLLVWTAATRTLRLEAGETAPTLKAILWQGLGVMARPALTDWAAGAAGAVEVKIRLATMSLGAMLGTAAMGASLAAEAALAEQRRPDAREALGATAAAARSVSGLGSHPLLHPPLHITCPLWSCAMQPATWRRPGHNNTQPSAVVLKVIKT